MIDAGRTVQIVVVDDHPVFREGLIAVLSATPGCQVVGEASDGAQGVERVDALEPDVVIMDLHMPRLNGVEATRTIVQRHPGVGVLVLTMLENDESVFAALRAGARGYLVKGASRDEIRGAVEVVAAGGVVVGPAVARQVLGFFGGPAGRPTATPFPELTAREREVLDLVARGLTNTAIAGRLYVSGKTVRNHVSNVMARIQAADRAEAIVRAREAGLGRSEMDSK